MLAVASGLCTVSPAVAAGCMASCVGCTSDETTEISEAPVDCGSLTNRLPSATCALAATPAACTNGAFRAQCAFACAGCELTTSTALAPTGLTTEGSSCELLTDIFLPAGVCATVTSASSCDVEAVRAGCAFTCAGCGLTTSTAPGSMGSTDITGEAIMYRGEFKHGEYSLSVRYRAPSSYTGLVDFFPVIRHRNGSATSGLVDTERTRDDNPGMFGLDPSGGVVQISIGLLRQADAGDYTVTVELTPAGGRYRDIFRKAEFDAVGHNFTLVTEYLRLDLEENANPHAVVDGVLVGTSVVVRRDSPSSSPQATLSFRYFSSTPVKIAAQVRCFQPPAMREADDARYGKCDNTPHLVRSDANDDADYLLPANAASGVDTAGSVTVTLFSGIYSEAWAGNTYYMDLSMGIYDDSSDENTWVETRDRSLRLEIETQA